MLLYATSSCVIGRLNLQTSSNICNSGHTNSELRQSMEGLCSSLVTFARELQRHIVTCSSGYINPVWCSSDSVYFACLFFFQ